MIIETERLRLRDFVEADWEAVLRYQRDPRYLQYYPWAERTEEDVRAFVRRFLDWQAEQPRYRFQLAIEAGGEVIGNVGIRLAAPGSELADLGFELAPEHWGRGYACEAAQAMLDYGFESLSVRRVGAQCIAENLASARVLERLGMRFEGRLHEAEHFKGRAWDVLLYGMLRRWWEAAREARVHPD